MVERYGIKVRMKVDNFRNIYNILSGLERSMDAGGPDPEDYFSPESLRVSTERFIGYLEMLRDEGYITDVLIERQGAYIKIDESRTRITLKGLDYLYNSAIMMCTANAIYGGR